MLSIPLRRVLSTLALLLLVSIPGLAHAAAKPIPNPYAPTVQNGGFEQQVPGDPTTPLNWTRTASGSGTAVRTNTDAHSGAWSVLLQQQNVAGVAQFTSDRFAVTTGAPVVTTLWARSSPAGIWNFLGVGVDYFTASGQPIPGYTGLTHFYPPAATWATLTDIADTAPPTATQAAVVLRIQTNAPVSVWIDDVSTTQLAVAVRGGP